MLLLSLLLRWALLALAVVLAAWATPDVHFDGGAFSALWVAVLISLANVVAQWTLRLLPTPGSFLLLAALTLVVNGVVVWIASIFTTSLKIDGFLGAVTFALMVSVFAVGLAALGSLVLARFDDEYA